MAEAITRTREQIFGRWIEALESGRIRQITGRLRARTSSKSYGYCCLGVLCNLAAQDGGPQWVSGGPQWENEQYGGKTSFDGSYGRLSKQMASSLGLDYADQKQLMIMNDNNHQSFKEIAEYIRTDLMRKAMKRK